MQPAKPGYRDDRNTAEFINYFIDKGMTDTVIHTSGHADREGAWEIGGCAAAEIYRAYPHI
ncbi:hypothetical protein [Natronogracilivirga saccharolytica]|uniref:Uncharacterized protein n=1 Tax=Natronogracilivirga saccharolytica TaxID=2812953 RepID=A0A8J7RSI8_9BACT|nr:hypothetical protein [Natronogracilivirga saccharolytica]MBP3192974.1 hypothetical protein [Natronogracilivirga saccharolytica]